MSDLDNPESFVQQFVDKDLGVTFLIHQSGSDGKVYASGPFRHDYIVYSDDKELDYCNDQRARRDCVDAHGDKCPGHSTRSFEGYLRKQGDQWLAFRKQGKGHQSRPLGVFDRQEQAAYTIYRYNREHGIMDSVDIVNNLLEGDDIPPEDYLKKLPPRFDAEDMLRRIRREASSFCMDSEADKRSFLKWIKNNENLFPDVLKAQAVVRANDSWCTDSDIDMSDFIRRLGFKPPGQCSRCDGSGEEPGAPETYDDDGNLLFANCMDCGGEGTIPEQCECDNTHQAQDTVCRWCWAQGRRHWNDPAV